MNIAINYVALVSLLLLGGCAGPDIPTAEQAEAKEFNADSMCLLSDEGAQHVLIELAKDFEQRAVGLMHREELPENAGMLFYYRKEDRRGFWMFQTLIPLDIAFIDSNGQILEIITMEPCLSDDPRLCQPYPSSYGFRAALEVNAGYFERHNIWVGDYALAADCASVMWRDWP